MQQMFKLLSILLLPATSLNAVSKLHARIKRQSNYSFLYTHLSTCRMGTFRKVRRKSSFAQVRIEFTYSRLYKGQSISFRTGDLKHRKAYLRHQGPASPSKQLYMQSLHGNPAEIHTPTHRCMTVTCLRYRPAVFLCRLRITALSFSQGKIWHAFKISLSLFYLFTVA